MCQFSHRAEENVVAAVSDSAAAWGLSPCSSCRLSFELLKIRLLSVAKLVVPSEVAVRGVGCALELNGC